MAKMRSVLTSPPVLGMVVFTAVLLIQAFHASEHVAQMVQRYALHLNRAPGLLGAWFDLEWVHLIYNTSLLVALAAVLVVHRRNVAMWRQSDLAELMLIFVLVFQGYHVVEHVVRVIQYLQHVPIPTPGILGRVFPILELHFWFNTVVTAAILIAYLGFRPWQPLLRREMKAEVRLKGERAVLYSVLPHLGGDNPSGVLIVLGLLVAAILALLAALRTPRLPEYQERKR